jgi:hypothetical protein
MTAMWNLDRSTLVAKFLAALHDASRRSPMSWRRVSAISARTGITNELRDMVVHDLVTSGLVQQHANDVRLIMLTDKGWEVATQ